MDHGRKLGISQEGLKVIACVTMLIDHIGAVFFPHLQGLRIIGRISFPLYCFLLSEGVHHTRNPLKYGLRLLLVAILSEIPYDLLLQGRLTWDHNSVMVTLLLGFGAAMTARHCTGWGKLVAVLPFALAAGLLHSDYGTDGVLMIAIFALTREIPRRTAVQFTLFILLSLGMAGFPACIGIQFYAVASLVPIFLYSGEKHSRNKPTQWAFTLFYPLHLLLLLVIRVIIHA